MCYNSIMDKFRYTVKLEIEIEAFDESDAWDAVQEAFGVGHTGAVVVTACEYREKRAGKR